MTEEEYEAFIDKMVDAYIDALRGAFQVPNGLLNNTLPKGFGKGGYICGKPNNSGLLHGGEYVLPMKKDINNV